MIVPQAKTPHCLIAQARAQLVEEVGPSGIVALGLIPQMQLRIAPGDEVRDAQPDFHYGAGQLRTLQFFA